MTYYQEYYKKNKDKYLERNKKWREANKERFYELVYKSRKKRAERLKQEGELYVWKSNVERKKIYEKRNRRIDTDDTKREI